LKVIKLQLNVAFRIVSTYTYHMVMLDLMTQKRPAGEKVAVNARLDADLVTQLDQMAENEGTVQFQRSRSELIAFAVREYVARHSAKPKNRDRR
jgi:hypothetical protein